MEHAARELAGTDRSILDIADECGLPNLAHFYKLFAARYGSTRAATGSSNSVSSAMPRPR